MGFARLLARRRQIAVDEQRVRRIETQRLERADAMREKVPLPAHQATGDPMEGLTTLIDVLDKELGTGDVVLDVAFFLLGEPGAVVLQLGGELVVERCHPEEVALRLDDLDVESAVALGDDDVWEDVVRLGVGRQAGPELAGWKRVEITFDELPDLFDLLMGDLEIVGDLAELVFAEIGQVAGDDLTGMRLDGTTLLLEVIELNQQAFAKVTSANPDRLERLNLLQDRRNPLDLDTEEVGDLLEAAAEPATLVEIADQILSNWEVFGREQRAQLDHQVFGQRELIGDLGQRIEFLGVRRSGRGAGELLVDRIEPVERGVVFLLLAQAMRADASVQRTATDATRWLLELLKSGVLVEFLGDRLLELQRRHLEDVVRRDESRRYFHPELRYERKVHGSFPCPKGAGCSALSCFGSGRLRRSDVGVLAQVDCANPSAFLSITPSANIIRHRA